MLLLLYCFVCNREMESESSQGFSNPVPMDEISLSGVYEEVKRQGEKSKPTLP